MWPRHRRGGLLRSVSWSATGEADVALRCAHGGDSVLLHLSAPRPGQREGKRVTAMLQLTWEGPEGSLQPGAAWRSRADLERVEALVGGDLRLAGDIDLEAAERHLHSSFDLLVPCVSGC